MARPSIFTSETAAEICSRLALGESLRAICQDVRMPGISTVMTWLSKDKEFQAQYAHARELQAEYLVDEIIEIADDGTNDYIAKRDAQDAIVGWRENGEFIQRSRLRVDARKWAASKLAPKKYGERAEIELTTKTVADTPLTPEEWVAMHAKGNV